MAKGQRCFAAMKTAHELVYTKGDAKAGRKILASLKRDGLELRRAAQEKKARFLEEAQQLNRQIRRLKEEEQTFHLEVSTLNDQKVEAEYHLENQERALEEVRGQLSEAEDHLKRAESDLRDAKHRERNVGVISVVAGGLLGLVTFGVGGIAVGTLVGGVTAATINNIEGRCREARKDVRQWNSEVSSAEESASLAREKVERYEHDILSYGCRIDSNRFAAEYAQNQVTALMESVAFCKTSCNFWVEFIGLSKTATAKTDLLEKLVNKAIQRDNISILRANGSIVKAKSFIEAWEEVARREQSMIAYS